MSFQRVLTVLAAALSLAVIVPSAIADALDDILEKGVVRIAVPQDFPPYGSPGKDGQVEGYDVDVARLLAKDLGAKLQLVPVTSVNRVPYLQVGKVDLVVATLGVSPERAKVIAFSNAYAPFYSGVYGNPKVQVKSAADLSEKAVIGVTRGTLEDAELGNLVPKNATIRRFDDNNATIAALIGGDVELIATGNVVAAAAAKKNPGKIEKKFVIRNSPAHIGVARGEFDLVAWVNAFIYQKKLNGELDALARKWFGEPLPDFPPF